MIKRRKGVNYYPAGTFFAELQMQWEDVDAEIAARSGIILSKGNERPLNPLEKRWAKKVQADEYDAARDAINSAGRELTKFLRANGVQNPTHWDTEELSMDTLVTFYVASDSEQDAKQIDRLLQSYIPRFKQPFVTLSSR